MAQAKKKTVKGEALVVAVDSAVSVLVSIASNTTRAISTIDKDNKKYTKEAKRLSKKKAVLMKKKKNATIKVKKSPILGNKKALNTIVKEIAAVTKDAAKNTVLKNAVVAELTTLKTVAKRTLAYNKSLLAADKILNKPKPKKKKRAKRPSVVTSINSIKNQAAA